MKERKKKTKLSFGQAQMCFPKDSLMKILLFPVSVFILWWIGLFVYLWCCTFTPLLLAFSLLPTADCLTVEKKKKLSVHF